MEPDELKPESKLPLKLNKTEAPRSKSGAVAITCAAAVFVAYFVWQGVLSYKKEHEFDYLFKPKTFENGADAISLDTNNSPVYWGAMNDEWNKTNFGKVKLVLVGLSNEHLTGSIDNQSGDEIAAVVCSMRFWNTNTGLGLLREKAIILNPVFGSSSCDISNRCTSAQQTQVWDCFSKVPSTAWNYDFIAAIPYRYWKQITNIAQYYGVETAWAPTAY